MDKYRILVVDDEKHVLDVLENICHHHDVTTEISSLKAAEIIKKEEFDIFIIDYQMPGIDGIELLKEIRKNYKKKLYVSILSTAYGTIYLFKEELIHGLFTFFIEKPFEIDVVKKVLQKAVVELVKIRGNVKKRKTDK
ncbi:MAG: response regulator [Spirochaetales bacterium]|nr:response regulator [Spirochaetales bacterium]